MAAPDTPHRSGRPYLEAVTRLVERLPAVVWTTDRDLRFTSSAGAGLATLGLEPDQVRGMSIGEYLGTGDPEHAALRAHRRALAGESAAFEIAFGGATWHATVMPLSGDGGIIGCAGIALDVTARSHAEGALERSEAHYRALVEEAPVGIFRSSREGRFLTVNPALVAMLGYDDADELAGLDLAADVYVEPDVREALMRRYETTDRVSGVDVDWRRKDGSRIAVRLSGRPVRDAAGSVQAWEMVAEDVTERRHLEHQLRTAQKMEALGLVTGGVAHDFNNLLTTILANTELIASALPASMAQTRSDLLEIQDAAARGSELVKKLLGFSRRERLVMEPVDVGALVTDMVEVLRRLLPERITILAAVEPGLPAVLADAGALQQVLLNLATNARDAIAENGEIRLAVRRAPLDEAFATEHGWGVPGEYVAIDVRDSGLGMDEATRLRVFEPFFTTKPPGAGSGLGLAMVYGLMKQHNGYVQVHSAPGAGTTATLYVPQTRRAAVAGAAPRRSRALHHGQTVLVVEDEEPIRRVAQRVLERHGYRVLAAADGLEALQLFREHEHLVAVILTDVVMPRMGGPALRDTLRGAGKTVPVVFTSGYARSDGEAEPLDPTVPYLAKPWSVEQLLAAVRGVLEPAGG